MFFTWWLAFFIFKFRVRFAYSVTCNFVLQVRFAWPVLHFFCTFPFPPFRFFFFFFSFRVMFTRKANRFNRRAPFSWFSGFWCGSDWIHVHSCKLIWKQVRLLLSYLCIAKNVDLVQMLCLPNISRCFSMLFPKNSSSTGRSGPRVLRPVLLWPYRRVPPGSVAAPQQAGLGKIAPF